MAFPNPMIVLLKGNQTLSIVGVVSETQEIVTYSDATTKSFELPAAYLGRVWPGTVADPFVSPGAPESRDDNFTNTVPTNVPKTRTMMKWWDAALGTGNVVGKCWQDQFIGYGTDANFVS